MDGAAMRRVVCKKCGGDKFRQYGEVEIVREISRPVEAITVHDDGSVSAKTGTSVDLEDLILDAGDFASYFGFECLACAGHEAAIEDLIAPEPLAGDKVNLPDGRTALIDEVEPADGEWIRVHAAGEWWDFQDVEMWEPHPDQVSLPVAA